MTFTMSLARLEEPQGSLCRRTAELSYSGWSHRHSHERPLATFAIIDLYAYLYCGDSTGFVY